MPLLTPTDGPLSTPIDVLFLDLNLNGKDGFDLLKTSVSGAFHVIIISAHTEQALKAFEYGVLDFVGKPFNKERLARALDRVFERIHKSYIVKMSTVAGLLIHEGSRYEVELNNGLMLPVGRTRYKGIKEKLGL